jgi:hypothetical protein
MTQSHRITLQLRCLIDADVDLDSTDGLPVEGELEFADGTVRPFTGWLGLINELERVVAANGAPGAGYVT